MPLRDSVRQLPVCPPHSGCFLRLFCARRHPAVCCSLVRHRADFRSEIKNRASVSLLPFRHCHGFSFRWVFNALPRTASLSPNQVKRAANGRVTDSGFKKKAMKTTNLKIEASAPANVRPSSRSKTGNSGQLQRLDFQKREANRRLPTTEVLNLLEREAPLLFRLAQIVGNWVWIQFPEKQPREITSMLAQIGFH